MLKFYHVHITLHYCLITLDINPLNQLAWAKRACIRTDMKKQRYAACIHQKDLLELRKQLSLLFITIFTYVNTSSCYFILYSKVCGV